MNVEPLKPSPILVTNEKKSRVLNRLGPVIALTGICWAVFLVNNIFLGGHLSRYGIIPRHLSALPGIFWSPFLHSSFKHLAANSVPLLVLGAMLCLRSKAEFSWVTLGGIIVGGGLTWLFGRTAIHIGASGLVFCFFGYLASLAFFKRNLVTIGLSLVCILVYGGVLKGVLPNAGPVSWEGHLAGLLAGITVAWVRSKEITIAMPGVKTP